MSHLHAQLKEKELLVRYYFLVLLFLVQGPFSYDIHAKPIWKKKWIEVVTPNFVITSQLNEKKTKKLAEDLENFRLVVALVTNIEGAVVANIPTHITVFSKRFSDLGFESNIGGAMIPLLRSNQMLVFSTRGISDLHIIQHEYVHFLMRNHNSLEYPPWFEEGFAEFLATVKIDDAHFTYGDISKNRIDWLSYNRWKPYDWLLNVRDVFSLKPKASAMYYAQAWALTHYLQLGRDSKVVAEEMSEYLRLRYEGIEPVPAFETAYNLPVKKLRGQIKKYLGRHIKYYKIKLKRPFTAFDTAIKAVPADVVASRIGFLCLIRGENENAKKYFSAALELNPSNTNALTGMGDVLKFAGKYGEAEPLYRKALEIEPNNALYHLDYGEYYFDMAGVEQNISHKIELYRQSRAHFENSLRLDSKNPETLAMYARSYLDLGERIELALDYLIEAQNQLPSHPEIKLLLAQAYVKMGFIEEAKRVLRIVLSWSHHSASELAVKLLKSIDPDFRPAEDV